MLNPAARPDPRTFALVVLRGVGQIMFQPHAGTGLCFLAGIALASPMMLAGAVLGALIGPATAYLAGFDRAEIEQGLYGFNATLVGLAVLVFLKPAPPSFGLLLLGCVAATFATRLAGAWKIPAYTAPFVLTTWLLLILAHAISGPGIDAASPPPSPSPVGFFSAVLRGEAEVMFGATAATGALFVAGLALSDPWHAAIAVLGSIAGTALAAYHGDPSGKISLGLYGYNAALAAQALFLRRKSLTTPILAALLATVLAESLPSLGLPALTAPFVAAAWIGLAVLRAEGRLFGPWR
ncbi:urea transporter [Paludisphaera soli]|uniref:urea transporter n=1 Tax=Paludisphaera soli TaxID=2712865 RepID=UPI001F10C484|nr:urea transporter [Paludisphaera soli]